MNQETKVSTPSARYTKEQEAARYAELAAFYATEAPKRNPDHPINAKGH